MTALPALAAAALGLLAFFIAYLVARTRRSAESGTQRSRRSVAGIAIQGVAFACACAGTGSVTLDPLGVPALALTAGVAIAMIAAIWLFAAATRAMGRNWSVVARTRDDHALVTAGPFAHVRHPIYVALFLLMAATTVALGLTPRLLVATPLYALGTWLRIAEEERLLREKFGKAYDEYATRVSRFIPRLF